MEGTDGVLCFVLLQNCNRSGMQFISNSYVHDLHMFYCLSCILFFWNNGKPVHSFFNILQTTTRYYSRYFEQLWIRKRLYSLMNLKRRVFLSKSNFIYKRKQNSFLKVWVEYLSLSMTQKKYTAISWFWLSIYYRESFCERQMQRHYIKKWENHFI